MCTGVCLLTIYILFSVCRMKGYNLYKMKLCEQVGLCRQQLVCLYKQPSRVVNFDIILQ